MPTDDEFRRVAEDVRALARSLAREARNAVDGARYNGDWTAREARREARRIAHQARHNFRAGWGGDDPNGEPGGRGQPAGAGPGWGGPRWGPGGPRRGGSGWGGPGRRYGPPWGGPGWHQGPGWPRQGPWQRPDGPPTDGPPREHAAHHGRPRPARPPLRHRWDRSTVVGVLVVVFGVSWLLDTSGIVSLSVEAVVAVALMLLGAALVVTGRTDWSLSRRSWPLFAGLAMIVILIVTSWGSSGIGRDITFGNVNFSPSQAAQLDKTVHGGFGKVTVDLSHVATPLKQPETLKIDAIAGDVEVVNVPPDIPIRVKGHLIAGQVCGLGNSLGNGVDVKVDQELQPEKGGPALTIDATSAFGRIDIAKGPNEQGCS